MTGFAAISANNGWAMAFIGTCIVMTGLAVLAFIISQLPKLVKLLDKQELGEVAQTPDTTEAISKEEAEIPEVCLTDIEQSAAAYQPLMDQINPPFDLKDLYVAAAKKGFPHTHLTIRSFRDTGRLVAVGDGMFTWNPRRASAVVPKEPTEMSPTMAPQTPVPAQTPTVPAPPPEVSEPAPEPEPAKPAIEGTAVIAPMPGMIVRYEKKTGGSVSEGETVVVLEAMKMENALPAPVAGTIKSINFASGDTVAKEDVLCVIG